MKIQEEWNKDVAEGHREWPDRVENFKALWRERGSGNTTVFAGDSFFDANGFWTDFYDTYRGKDALCFGIGSTHSYHWEFLADSLLKGMEPHDLVMHIGTNNVYDRGDSAEMATDGLQHMFTVLHECLPRTKLWFFTITQRDYDEGKQADVSRINREMIEWCARRSWIVCVDTSAKMTCDMLKDGVHPKLEYYSVFVEALEEAGLGIAPLRSYKTGDAMKLPTRTEYPRPQLKRDEWLPLNGEWQFCFDDENRGLTEGYDGGTTEFPLRINVPFSYQYPASGIGSEEHHETVWYRRTFPDRSDGRRTLLCFNAADHETDVWINGRHAVRHTGGFSPFTADITPYIGQGENVIVVRCADPLDPALPRGKQSWTGERFGCWYLPNTGIWQSVWLEYFGNDGLSGLQLCTDADKCTFSGELVTFYGRADAAEFTLTFQGKLIKRERFALEGRMTRFMQQIFTPECMDPACLWAPERPNLFYLDIVLFCGGAETDRLHTRFGMRKIGTDGCGNVRLNDGELYQKLVLDQGYWRESGLTPPSAEALRQDISLAKQMGFNGARKHQKFEDPYYYYFAEELGFLVWCEMPSAYSFCTGEISAMLDEWKQIVLSARNFTSVICYVPLNESWGVHELGTDGTQQDFARALYYATKSLDPTRPISLNDGWENLSETDFVSVHDYAADGGDFAEKYRLEGLDLAFTGARKVMADGNSRRTQPVLLTEWGGIAMAGETGQGNWGYNSAAEDREEFYARYENLIEGICAAPFCGYCYTQLTDVQQEVNGLLYADRTPKFDVERIAALNGKIKKGGTV